MVSPKPKFNRYILLKIWLVVGNIVKLLFVCTKTSYILYNLVRLGTDFQRMLSATLGLDDSAGEKKLQDDSTNVEAETSGTSSPNIIDVEQPQQERKTNNNTNAHISATDRDVTISERDTYMLRKRLAQERLERYSAKHLKGDLFAVAKVQRAVINIQRMMRGKLARKQYNDLQESRFALIELVLYLMYILMHVSFAAARKNTIDAYYLSTIMEDSIVHEEFAGPNTGGGTYIKKTFLDVATEEELWEFLEGPLRSNVFPEKCRDPEYRGDPCLGAMHTYDHIVGVVRFRQFRVEAEADCKFPALMNSIPSIVASPCYGTWDMDNPSRAPYGLAHPELDPSKWSTTQNKTFDSFEKGGKYGQVEDCFKFTDTSSTDWITKQFQSFSGGWLYTDSSSSWQSFNFGGGSADKWSLYPSKEGFDCDLHPDVDPLTKIQALKEFHWIDQQTRAVLVELSVYNKPTNLFSSMRLFFEFPRTGGVVPYFEPYTGKLFSNLDTTSAITEFIFLGLIVFMTLGFMLQEIGEMRDLGFSYFASMWNILDWLSYTFIIFVTFYFIMASLEAQETLGNTEMVASGEYIDIFSLVYKYRMTDYVFSMNLIFVFVKLLKYVRLSPKLSLVTETLTSTFTGSVGFFVIFVLLIVAYAGAFWYSYGSIIFEFRTLWNSIVSFCCCFFFHFKPYQNIDIEHEYYLTLFLSTVLLLPLFFFIGVVWCGRLHVSMA